MSGGTERRKRDHLEIALRGDVGFTRLDTGLDHLRLRARALPEHDLADVDLSSTVFGRRLAAPVLVSCMTGGTSAAGDVNRALAAAAQEHGIALGLGSGRILLEDESAAGSFRVRDVAPDVLLLANLGAVQLHRYGAEDCRQLVDAIGADGLVLHLNAVQEAIQPGGDTGFGGLLERITALCAGLDVPVLVKEVGFGMAPEDIDALAGAGVAGIDVAGAGGTNWARVEGQRDDMAAQVATAFADWGWPTVDALRAGRAVLDERGDGVLLIASGGLRHGVDALKCLCLGADLVGFGRRLLAPAARGPDAATASVGVVVRQLRVAAWACGAGHLAQIGPALLQH